MLPVPEIGLNLIGKDRIRGWVDLHGGYNNRVWKVIGHDRAWIVKSFRSPWLRRNEVTAIGHLGPSGLAPGSFLAQSATVLIWPDDGLTCGLTLDEGLARSMGYALRRIHDSGPVKAGGENAEWRLVNRVGRTASKTGGYAARSQGPIHGDARLGNTLVDASGRFVRFSDFEEFGMGDQASDLVLCLLETACDSPDRAGRAMEWVVEGYMARSAGRLTELSGQESRSALALAALPELTAWAEAQGVRALIERYERRSAAALEALKHLPHNLFA